MDLVHAARQRSTGPSSPKRSTPLTRVKSHPAHDLGVDEVLPLPRDSQIPLSGLVQASSSPREPALQFRPSIGAIPASTHVAGAEHLARYVALDLARRRCPRTGEAL